MGEGGRKATGELGRGVGAGWGNGEWWGDVTFDIFEHGHKIKVRDNQKTQIRLMLNNDVSLVYQKQNTPLVDTYILVVSCRKNND